MALEEVRRFVREAGLTLHPDKTHIVDSRVNSFDFLGYSFRGKLRFPRAKSHRKMVDTIRRLTPRKSGQSLEATIAQINRVTVGWFSYFRHCTCNIFDKYDGMVRKRLRRQLLKRHRRNPERLCRTHRWPNAYFSERGYRSLRLAHSAYVQSLEGTHRLESRVRESRTHGSEVGESGSAGLPYHYQIRSSFILGGGS